VANGSHTFDVEAVDPSGNVGTPASYTWAIDTVPPVTSITAQPAALASSSSPSFGFSADTAGSTFECRIDGGAYGACTSPRAYAGLSDGSHTFDVRATDPAGNTGAAASAAWTIDAAAPAATITARPDAVVASSGAALGAGNVGPRSDPLVAVPNLIGLNLGGARAALKQRGLALGERHSPAGSLVTGQSPAPPAGAAPGGAVDVTLATPQRRQQPPAQTQPGNTPAAKRALSIVLVGQRNVSCRPTDRLSLQIGLSSSASVTVRFLDLRGVPLASRRVGTVRAGSRQLVLQLPAQVAHPGRYSVIVLAAVRQQLVRAEMKFSLRRAGGHSGTQAATCGSPDS
jgi:hypothetical protein